MTEYLNMVHTKVFCNDTRIMNSNITDNLHIIQKHFPFTAFSG